MTGRRVHGRCSTAAHAVVFVGLLTLAASAGVVVADQAAAASDDWELTLRAKSALWDDPTFAKMNLGVRVSRGVATLHGPVPSTAVAEQALARLRQVPGLREFVNETYVPPTDEKLNRSMPHPVTSARPSVTIAPPSPTEAAPRPLGTPPSPPQPAAVPAPTVGEPTVTIMPPISTPARQETLGEKIDQLRQRERQFQNIRAEVRDGWVTLLGTVPRPQDAWEFAELVQKLPGVKGVSQRIVLGVR